MNLQVIIPSSRYVFLVFSLRKRKLPVTEYVSQRVVTLPLDAKITNSEVKKVSRLVKEFDYSRS